MKYSHVIKMDIFNIIKINNLKGYINSLSVQEIEKIFYTNAIFAFVDNGIISTIDIGKRLDLMDRAISKGYWYIAKMISEGGNEIGIEIDNENTDNILCVNKWKNLDGSEILTGCYLGYINNGEDLEFMINVSQEVKNKLIKYSLDENILEFEILHKKIMGCMTSKDLLFDGGISCFYIGCEPIHLIHFEIMNNSQVGEEFKLLLKDSNLIPDGPWLNNDDSISQSYYERFGGKKYTWLDYIISFCNL